MRLIDEQFVETPFYGARQMSRHLRRCGYCVGRKRVRRLMARMGLAAVYQKPRTSVPHPDHVVFPYLLRYLSIVSRGLWERSPETAFYISNTMLTALNAADAIRGHWMIETTSHYGRDVTF